MIPKFDASNLTNIAQDPGASGASDFLPFGYAGILGAFVYGIWFFLAIEGVPLAAEETRNPKRDMPKGLIAGMAILLLFAALILATAAGGGGADTIKESDNPLPEALSAAYGDNWLKDFVNYVGLAGLIASFFSIIYGYSRQLFALSRAGYLPRALSVTSGRRTPTLALLIPGLIGFVLAWRVDDGAILINIAVFGATVSYVLMMLSHIVLRRREPNLERPYRTPGGVVTTGIALVLAVAAVIATFDVDKKAAGYAAAVFVAFLLYFVIYSRHRLVADAPEEEFEAIERAEAELAGS
jgi:ethanolamine permease